MDIKNIAELAKLVDLCRKKGVESIRLVGDEIEFKLLEKPKQTRRKRSKEAQATAEATEIPTYTEEELLLWSSTDHIEGRTN